jgi:hypothetical protein
MNNYKRCKVVMLPTDKAENAILVFKGRNKFAEYHKDKFFTQQYLRSMGTDGCNSFHLYILSDDEIEEGDWVYDYIEKHVKQCKPGYGNAELFNGVKNGELSGHLRHKIIASTDSSLVVKSSILDEMPQDYKRISGFIPRIPQSFIDYYVSEYNKGNKIEEIMVEYTDYIQCKGEMLYFNSEHDLASPEMLDYYKCNICGNIRRGNSTSLLSNKRICGKKIEINLLKLNPDNTINIKSIKDSWTKEEVITLCNAAFYHKDPGKGLPYDYSDNTFDKWIESNL